MGMQPFNRLIPLTLMSIRKTVNAFLTVVLRGILVETAQCMNLYSFDSSFGFPWASKSNFSTRVNNFV
jgi:hypothetical protein